MGQKVVVVIPKQIEPAGDQKSTPEKVTGSETTALVDKGRVEDGTYKNPSIGLEFTPADNLRLQEPEMKGTLGALPLLITISAFADRNLFGGIFSPRSVTVFYADALVYYPEEQRNRGSYLQKVIRANEVDGYRHLNGPTSGQLSGILCERADFAKGQVHETVLVTTHNSYAFVFIFADASEDRTNELITKTKVALF